MFKRFGKRGSGRDLTDKILFLMWELIVLGILAIVVLMTVRSIATNSTFWKKYYSVDLASIAEIENTNRGDFLINYDIKSIDNNFYAKILGTRIFEIGLGNNKITAYDAPKEKDTYAIYFPYAKNKLINARNSSVISDFLVLNKVKNNIYLDTYYVGESSGCPAFDTKKDINNFRFRSISLDPKTNAISTTIANSLTSYGRTPYAPNELMIIIAYDTNLAIFYSNDEKQQYSQKMACIISTKLNPANPQIIDIQRYDDSLSNIGLMQNYLASKEPDEYWIIIKITDSDLANYQNNPGDLATKISSAITEYYS